MEATAKERLERINQQIKEMAGIYRNAVSSCGVSENEFWIWYALIVMEGDLTQQDISGIWSVSKQTVNTIITHMVQKGYVTLEFIPGSRNRKRIALTESGRRCGEALVMPVFQAEQQALEGLTRQEQDAFTAILEKYIRKLKESIYEPKEL